LGLPCKNRIAPATTDYEGVNYDARKFNTLWVRKYIWADLMTSQMPLMPEKQRKLIMGSIAIMERC